MTRNPPPLRRRRIFRPEMNLLESRQLLAADPSLVAEWAFDETGGTVASDSAGADDAALVGSVSRVPGRIHSAVGFAAGGGGKVVAPDEATLKFSASQSFTLSAWVSVGSTAPGWQGVVTKARDSANWYGIWVANGQWVAASQSGNLFGSQVTAGWHDVAVVQDGSAGTRTLYVDGVSVATGAAEEASGPGNLWVGGAAGVSEFLTGSVDDVRVYSRALTTSDLTALANPPAVSAPAAPTALSGTAASSTQVNLAWTNNAVDQTGFTIFRSTDGSTFSQAGQVGATITTYQDGGLTAGLTYFYRIRATNAVGDSGDSNTASVRTEPVGGLVAEWAFGEGSGTVAHDSSGGFDAAVVGGAVWTNSGPGTEKAMSFPAGVGAHLAVPDQASLRFSATQSFTLSAWVSVDLSSSGWQGVVTKARDSSHWYGIWVSSGHWWVGASDSGNLIGSEATAGWHNVVVAQDGSAGTRTLSIDGQPVATGPSQDATGPGDLWIGGAVGVSEFFTGSIGDIRIYSRALSTSEITALSVPPTLTPPDAPTSLSATFSSSSQINLSWPDSPREAGFLVERSTDGTTFLPLARVGTGLTTYSDTGLSPSTNYFYRVRAFNPAGYSGYSPTASVTRNEGIPTSVNDSYTVDHDRTFTTTAANGVLANDTDPAGARLTASLIFAAQNGFVNLNPDGSFSYTPAAGFVGDDSFSYQASNGFFQGNITTVTLLVGDLHAPVAHDNAYTTIHDTTLIVSYPTMGVLGNATDADGDALTASVASSPQNGTLTLNPDGTFTYVPASGFYGQDSFTYYASDGLLVSRTATTRITVTPTGSPTTLTLNPIYTDDFIDGTLDPAWQPAGAGGTWSINPGTLNLTSTAPDGLNVLGLTGQVLPPNLMITAKVQAAIWSGDNSVRAGVALNADPSTGDGYSLVLRGINTVQFLDGPSTWGNAYAFDWTPGLWYNFALEIVGTTLYGKVWSDGATEPSAWMFQQNGWTDRANGIPALVGATASFQTFALYYAPDAPADYAPTPIIDYPASASEPDVTGTTTELSVSASVPGDPSDLTYSWSVESMPSGAFAPQLSDNNSATAGDVTATFTMAGDYTFLVTVGNHGSDVTSDVTVTVEQTVTSLFVSPPDAFVHNRDTKQFEATAEDQFGHQLDSPPSFSWSLLSGPGSIDSSGLYTAPVDGTGEAIAQVTAGDVSATVKVEITNQDVIDFNALILGTVITNQYPEATFSADPGLQNQATGWHGIGTYPPSPDPARFNHNLYVDFTFPVNELKFEYVGIDSTSGTVGQVRVYQNGTFTATVPMVATGSTTSTEDLTAYDNITRVEIVNVTDPYGLWYDNFAFTPCVVQLTPHRTGDFQGDPVSDAVKKSGDSSQYLILTDNDYVQADGTQALNADTAEIPNPTDGTGNNDLAQITLGKLWSGLTSGELKIILSDPTAVRLFKSDGSLLYDGTTGDGVLTLDLSSPSGYLAGLLSGGVDVWLEGVHQVPDFDFAVVYEAASGKTISHDDVHLTIADWTFRNDHGEAIGDIVPIWEQTLLDDSQASDIQPWDQSPDNSLFKSLISGLPDRLSRQLQVQSASDASDAYTDDLLDLPGGSVSNHFQAVYSSQDFYGTSVLAALTPDQRNAILAMLGINLVGGPGAMSTLILGQAGNPTDKFTRGLKIPGTLPSTLNNPDGVYKSGDTVSVKVDAPAAKPEHHWAAYAELSDGRTINGTFSGGDPNTATITFLVASLTKNLNGGVKGLATNYLTVNVHVTDHIFLDAGDGKDVLVKLVNYEKSITIAVLPIGKTMSTWQTQTWKALQDVNGIVTGDPIQRNEQITRLYTAMFKVNTSAFEWSGMAAFASYLAGVGMKKAEANRWISIPAKIWTGLELLQLRDYLGQGNISIFADMYPQMLAYQDGFDSRDVPTARSLDNIQAMLDRGDITQEQFNGWKAVDDGLKASDSSKVWIGQKLFAKVEQFETLQAVLNLDLPMWKKAAAAEPLQSPYPGDPSTFQDDDVSPPGASFGNPYLRFAWFNKKMVPAYKLWRTTNPVIDINTLLSGGYKKF